MQQTANVKAQVPKHLLNEGEYSVSIYYPSLIKERKDGSLDSSLLDELNNYYCVTNHGRVYSTKAKRFILGRVLGNGYVAFSMKIKGKTIQPYAHRLLAFSLTLEQQFGLITYNPTIDQRLVVHHKDENKANNSLDNIEVCTASYNSQESIKAGSFQQTLHENKVYIVKFVYCKYSEHFNSLREIQSVYPLMNIATLINTYVRERTYQSPYGEVLMYKVDKDTYEKQIDSVNPVKLQARQSRVMRERLQRISLAV